MKRNDGKIIVVGIDVGFSGALVVMDSDDKIISNHDMPVVTVKKGKKENREIDEPTLRELIVTHRPNHVFIEKAQTMPGQGISSAGRYMMSYGIIRGICCGVHIPYTLVPPQTWKKVMMKGIGSKEKGASIVRAKQLFPDLVLGRVKDHGKADALLIACYGLKELGR